MAIREKAGVIAKKIEGNPLDPEKAAKDQIEDPKVETKRRKLHHQKKLVKVKSSLIIKRRLI